MTQPKKDSNFPVDNHQNSTVWFAQQTNENNYYNRIPYAQEDRGKIEYVK